VSRLERTGWRDQAYSRWHRSLDRHNRLKTIDLDWIEYCGRCMQPLALFELCADLERTDKAYTVTRNLSLLAGLPAWCVLYKPSTDGEGLVTVRVKQIAPVEGGWTLAPPSRLARLIRRLHAGCPHCQGSPALAARGRPRHSVLTCRTSGGVG
jgi:hypothetical protein